MAIFVSNEIISAYDIYCMVDAKDKNKLKNNFTAIKVNLAFTYTFSSIGIKYILF